MVLRVRTGMKWRPRRRCVSGNHPKTRLLKKPPNYTTCSRSGSPRPYILWCHGSFSAVSKPGGFPLSCSILSVWDSNSQHFSRGWSGQFFAPVTTVPRHPRTSSPGIERRPAPNLRALVPAMTSFSNPGGVAAPALKWSPAHLVALVRAGAKFENGVLVERPDESASGDTHAA